MKSETEHCTGLTMNICMSYGSRGEILNATRSIAANVLNRSLSVDAIDEAEFERHLLTSHCGDPDVLIRTSGEIRISNYLLWQLAYSEMFFVEKPWPAIEKADLLHVIRTFGLGRIRRYGK
jgi:undecaprenyl diphosphate synthase